MSKKKELDKLKEEVSELRALVSAVNDKVEKINYELHPKYFGAAEKE